MASAMMVATRRILFRYLGLGLIVRELILLLLSVIPDRVLCANDTTLSGTLDDPILPRT
jgi:hypothetical protein